MANLRDLANKVKEYLTAKPMVSAQPWNTAGQKPSFTQDQEGWIRGGKFTPGKQISEFVNKQTEEAWKPTGVAFKTTTGLQSGLNKISNLSRIEFNKPQVSSPVLQTGINLAYGIPESIANIPRNYITGIARTGKELGTAYREGRGINLQNLAGGVAPLAESLIDVGTFGGGTVAKNIAKTGAKQTIKQALLKGAVKGAGVGGLGGLTYGLDTQYGKEFNPKEVLTSVAGGALLGGTLGGAIGAVPAVANTVKNAYKNLGISDEVASALTKQHFINTENKPITFRQPKAQKEFWSKVNKELGRPLDTPVYQDDLKGLVNKKSGIPDTQLSVGMQIKPKQPLPTTQTTKNITTPIQSISHDIQPSAVAKIKSTQQIEIPKTNKVLPQTSIIPKPEEVAVSLPSKVDNFIQKTLGYTTQTPVGGTKEASLWTKTLRKGQERVGRSVESGLGDQNQLVRNAASTLQNFFRGIGMSPERSTASMQLRGEMSVANERAFNVMDSLYKSLDNNKNSLERINSVLDPSISKLKVSYNDLSGQEKQVFNLIREGLDIVHDTSYANGHISPELYAANKGKYVPRLYDVTELPEEVSSFVNQGKKIDNNLYKSRKDIDAWKIDNSLNDPVYALGKRLAQVETNSAIKKYTDFLSSNQRFVSDVERPGFVKLSDSPAYGNLKGKYVLNSAAEDLKGFFFSNEAMQNLYDAFRAYDRMPIRQLQKKLLTVFNPTTNVGNVVSDQVFGFVTGVDPLTLNKNLLDLKQNPKKFKQLNDYLIRNGINATDITRTDFVNKLGKINDLSQGKKDNIIKIIADKQTQFYGGTDDAYKVSAFKSLLDKGFSLEEATRKVADGFQNYANVGKFYDLAAKTPIVGKPFIKFQGDLIRIIKNGAVNNPLGLIGFLGTLWGVARLSSKLSGESDEDRQYRENRFGAPMIPGLNIPLTWQTPMGEINVARYISPFYANNETTNIASNMLPFVPNVDIKKDVASNISMNVNDPLVSPLVQLAVNRDFRGKPIADVNENIYQPSTLTPGEKLSNQAKFLGRSYTPPTINSAIDVVSAAKGGTNMYGAKQSVPQAIARLGGIKIQQYGSEQVAEAKLKDQEYQSKQNDFIDKQINAVYKQGLKGEITEEQVQKRVKNLEEQKKNITEIKSDNKSSGDSIPVYRYLDDKGDMQTVDITKEIVEPKYTGVANIDKKLKSAYKGKLTKRGNDIVKLYEAGKITLEQATALMDEIEIKANSTKTSKSKSVKIKSVKYSTPKLSKSSFKNPSVIKSAPAPVTASVFKGNIKIAKPKKIKVKSFRNTLAVTNKLV